MFTGLVEDLGRVAAVQRTEDGARLQVQTALAAQLEPGDSIMVNGVCLTAVEPTQDAFAAAAVHETLERSSIGGLDAGAQVNLELAMRVGDRLGGHIVQGHVDGLGTIAAIVPDGFSRRIRIDVAGGPADGLLRYVVEKGSIAVDGISLTVAAVDDAALEVALIPETLERTTLGAAQVGSQVNLEVDVMAKHAEKLLAGRLA